MGVPIVAAVLALLAQSPGPTPPDIVSPAPQVPPPSNAGTMALWIGISVLVVLSALAYLMVRRRGQAAAIEQLDRDTAE